MLRARAGCSAMRPGPSVRSIVPTPSPSLRPTARALPRSRASIVPKQISLPHPVIQPSRKYSNKPRRVFQVAGIPDPRIMPQQAQQELAKTTQEVPLYYATAQKKYVRYFLVGAGVQMTFTSIGAHMIYQAWLYQQSAPAFLQGWSEGSVMALCSAFIGLGLACFGLVWYNARRRVTSITLLPGGKKVRVTTFTMFGNVSRPFELDLADIERGKWVVRDDGKEEPAFYVKGKRMGFALDPAAKIDNLPLLKAVIKHPSNV